MDSNPTSILYDHYKDTCSITGEAVRRRDRAMLLVILSVSLFAIEALFPSAANQVVTEYLRSHYGLNFQLNLSVIGNVVWFLLHLFTLRYFQTAVFVERQYVYLHSIEDRLNALVGQSVVMREGKAYLANYPWFSNWMWVLYTIIFPGLLLFVGSVKIAAEWALVDNYSFGLLLDSGIFLLLGVSIVLYLVALHFKTESRAS